MRIYASTKNKACSAISAGFKKQGSLVAGARKTDITALGSLSGSYLSGPLKPST